MTPAFPSRQAGFTLVEAVMVIVITGILASMVAVFIVSPVRGYADTARRAEMSDAADTALRRLARDVRLALPNSLRMSSSGTHHYIEFILSSAGGRYRDMADGSADPTPASAPDCDSAPTPANGPCVLDFVTAGNTSFDVMGPMPDPALANGDHIVVFNLGSGYEPANAYTDPGTNRARVSSVSGNTVTLQSNPFASDGTRPPLPSPGNRFQVVRSADQAVTYECRQAALNTPGPMTRYWAYGFRAAPPTSPPGGSSALIIDNATCEVEYSQNVSFRNALLYIKITVTDGTASGEKIEVFQQIHVDNSP